VEEKQDSLFANLRALPRPAWILFFGTFLNKFGTFVLPFLTLYLRDIGYSTADAGFAIAAYGVGNLSASLVGGYLADKVGRRKTIVLSMFSGGIAMLLLSQAHSLPWILLFSALVGLTGEFYRPASSALLTDLVPPERRVTAFSAYRMAFNAGWACGPAAAGFLASRGYLWLFVGDAATTFLFGFVALFALPKHTGVGKTSPGWGPAWQVMRRDRKLQQLLLAVLCVAFVVFQMSTTLSLYITGLGFSLRVYAYILSLNGVMVVFCELPLTTITQRFPARNVIATGFLLMGLGVASYAFARTIPALAGSMALLTLGEMCSVPVASAYVANLSPPNMRGRYAGAHSLTWGIVLVFAPAVGMRMLTYNPAGLWIACGMLGLLSAGIIMVEIGRKADIVAPVKSAEELGE
jgi:MFS family permease